MQIYIHLSVQSSATNNFFLTNCPAIRVTEKTTSFISEMVVFDKCLVITVTENGTKLWSITLTESEVLDQATKDAVFYQS